MSDVGVDESAPSPTGADASSSGNLAEELLNQRMAAEELIESMQAQSSPARTDPPADDHPFRTEPQWEESAQAEEASSPRLAAPPLKYLTPAEAPRTAIPEARRPSRPESRTKGLIMQIAILMLTLLAIWMSVYLFFLY
jgi:hypothetical protein